jgi:glycosyltransferase involved in cell wall biosynthesis
MHIILVHETNPKKYFPAVFLMAKENNIKIECYRYSVFKEFFRSLIKDRSSFKSSLSNSLLDVLFRFRLPFLKGKVVLLGFAPWDFRIIYYYLLVKRNKIVYHTSWHDWDENKVPRGGFNGLFKKLWINFLNNENVKIVSVLEESRKSMLANCIIDENKRFLTIPHAVDNDFYEAGLRVKLEGKRCNKKEKIKLVYVGELSEKKGIKRFIELSDLLGDNFEFNVIGDGELREVVKSSSKINYLGRITTREVMAKTLSQFDILVLLQKRTSSWEELFGMVIPEAIACGLGVISSNHIGPSNILSNVDLNCLVEDGDVVEAVSILESITDLDLYKSAFGKVSQEYNVKEVSKAWFGFVNE